ncbi:MAG: DNA polymerase, partial [Candidatus Gracilibacteria bacterium]
MGAKKFMEYYNQNSDKPIDLETASKFRRDFFSVFPRLSYWHKEVGDKAVMATEQNPYISKTLIGRRRIFTDKAYSAAINAPVQGTSADITKYALLFLFFSLKNFNDAKIVNTVHDEIVVECCEEEANVMSSALKSVMEWGGFFMKHVPVVVETTVANNWSEKS